MKTIILCFVSIVISVGVYGQVKVKAPAQKVVAPYDSLVNILPVENVKAYIGQSFFVKPRSEGLRNYGYDNFYTEPKSNYKTVYSPMQEYGASNSKHESLANRTFQIVGVETEGTGDHMLTYLKLADDVDTIYYRYTIYLSETNAPFLITGYVEKLNKLYVGQSYYLIKRPDEFWPDFETGENVKLMTASLWKCVEVVLDGKNYWSILFILKNEKGETISDEMERVIDEVDFISKKNGDRYKKKYGVAAFQRAMSNP